MDAGNWSATETSRYFQILYWCGVETFCYLYFSDLRDVEDDFLSKFVPWMKLESLQWGEEKVNGGTVDSKWEGEEEVWCGGEDKDVCGGEDDVCVGLMVKEVKREILIT